MTIQIGIPKENHGWETRVAASPDGVKRLTKLDLSVWVERGAGVSAHFPDNEYAAIPSVTLVDRAQALSADIVLQINPLKEEEVASLKSGALLVSFLLPHVNKGLIQKLTEKKVSAVSMELIPRISRAQSMDALSSQANLAGYRGVLEAASHFGRFFPMMMTSAGSSKPARVMILGAGVAGLQAIGTARRLGANVEAYDIREAVKEEVKSLGAKFIEIQIGEEGTGAGGYARELSPAAKKKQQQALDDVLKKADIIIATASVPGKKAPILVSEEVVKGLRPGSVIIDLSAANGGNCALTEPGKTVVKHGVTIVGIENYPGLIPTDASNFYGRNLVNLLSLMVQKGKDGNVELQFNMEDEIIKTALVTHRGELCLRS